MIDNNVKLAEYIWLDGTKPTRAIRSKARVIKNKGNINIKTFPEWSFDGSSTNQAEGGNSDCTLKPVSFVPDPIRGEENYLVICEVYMDDKPHSTNSRAKLRAVLEAGAKDLDAVIGFEQEYTLFNHRTPLGWPEFGFPGPQGPYYCGIGSEQIFGRELIEVHAKHCLHAGLTYFGLNAEVMPGQWEFQMGYRDIDTEDTDPLTVSDDLLFARWLLQRISEDYGIHVSFDNKPIKGEWNGAGMHTNFSTKYTRDKEKGMQAIKNAIKLLEKTHELHIKSYGDKLNERLTGDYETCDIGTFKAGVADRGCSIRIPKQVSNKGYGYFEDRRPGANAEPYVVTAHLCATLANIDINKVNVI